MSLNNSGAKRHPVIRVLGTKPRYAHESVDVIVAAVKGTHMPTRESMKSDVVRGGRTETRPPCAATPAIRSALMTNAAGDPRRGQQPERHNGCSVRSLANWCGKRTSPDWVSLARKVNLKWSHCHRYRKKPTERIQDADP